MFDAVKFERYKCLVDVTIPLGRLTVLVGANASGKSSVLDGLDALCQVGATSQPLPHGFFSRSEAVFRGRRRLSRIRTNGESGPVHLEGMSDGQSAFAIDGLPGAVPNGSDQFKLVVDGGSVDEGNVHSLDTRLAPLRYGATVRLRLEAHRIAEFVPDVAQPQVGYDGRGTPAVLAWLAEQRSAALEAIELDLQKILGRPGRLLLHRQEGEQRVLRSFSLKTDSGIVPANLLSEGTLLTIGLLTVLHGVPRPRLVLLDDFDRGLHPSAQRRLVDAIKGLVQTNSDLQFVCTTHSPYVLDYFDAADVRVLRADKFGHTHARKLTEHPEWQQWSTTMKAGEFWSYVGEDWLDTPSHAA